MILLLMFSITLVGCGGGTEEPAAEETATDKITKEMLTTSFNDVVALYNEVYTMANDKGIYGTDQTVTDTLNGLNNTMTNLAPVIQADDSSDEDNQVYYDSLGEILVELDNMKTALESM